MVGGPDSGFQPPEPSREEADPEAWRGGPERREGTDQPRREEAHGEAPERHAGPDGPGGEDLERDEPGQAAESPTTPAAFQRLVREAGLYAGFFFLAAVVVALVGGALLALLVAAPLGYPFLRAWLLIAAVLLGLPLLGQGILALIERLRGTRGGSSGR